MLSKEERKALERIEDFLTTNIIISISTANNDDREELKAFISKNEYLAIEFIATMFLKQSKEIEELKKPKYFINSKTNEITKLTNDFVSKDKIKEILEIEEKIDNEKLLSLLQTIVDENARLEDIEDRKVQIEYNNVFNKGVKSVEDKIKAKIEEYDDKGMTINLANRSAEKTFQQAVHYEVRKVLQSLLEKE